MRLIREAGGKAEPFPADIGALDNHPRLLDDVRGAFGGLECLVNNAGISVERRDDLLKVTPESFDRLIGVNLRGTFFLTQAAATRMIAAPSGRFARIARPHPIPTVEDPPCCSRSSSTISN